MFLGTQWCKLYHQHQICLRLAFLEVEDQLGPNTREVWFSVPQEHSCLLSDYKPWKQRPFPGGELYRLGCLDVQHPINPPEGIRCPEDVTASLELAQQRRDPPAQQQGGAEADNVFDLCMGADAYGVQ